jgi:hypothetical protein
MCARVQGLGVRFKVAGHWKRVERIWEFPVSSAHKPINSARTNISADLIERGKEEILSSCSVATQLDPRTKMLSFCGNKYVHQPSALDELGPHAPTVRCGLYKPSWKRSSKRTRTHTHTHYLLTHRLTHTYTHIPLWNTHQHISITVLLLHLHPLNQLSTNCW